MTPKHSLYFHIPFCTHRCAYCDFNTYAGQEEMIPAYVEALIRELEYVGRVAAERRIETNVHTIFFGGGTPSLLTPKQFDSIFKAIRANFTLTEDAEITMEANPGTVTYDALRQLREIGINRISFGVQSADMEELRMLERTHDFFDVIEAVTSARKAGFDRQSNGVNLDLIYALPEQTLQTWQTTVKRILDLDPEHISAYALTLEHGTPFGRWASKGLLPLPDPDLAAEMYEWVSETLESNGYVQYEISNWAKNVEKPALTGEAVSKGQKSQVDVRPLTFDLQPSTPAFACLHNLQYWRSLPYLAFGAGAHGYADGYRYSNVLRIKTYIERLSNIDGQISNIAFPLSPVTVNQHKQSLKDDMSEFMMTGLRLTQEGISSSEFEKRFGIKLHDAYRKEIDELLKLGLIEWTNDSPLPEGEGLGVRVTKHGRLLGNQVFMRFV